MVVKFGRAHPSWQPALRLALRSPMRVPRLNSIITDLPIWPPELLPHCGPYLIVDWESHSSSPRWLVLLMLSAYPPQSPMRYLFLIILLRDQVINLREPKFDPHHKLNLVP